MDKSAKKATESNLPIQLRRHRKPILLWADCVPLSWKPYVQLTRIDLFAGSVMLFWPLAWTFALVRKDVLTHYSQYVPQLATWVVYAIFLHSVGSTWNDICDIDFDRQVERTKNRPLPSGTISVRAAALWMCPQVAILMALLVQYNRFTVMMGIFQLFILAGVYPFAKRFTDIPQAWLGITVSCGVLVSWSANDEPFNWTLIGVLYTTITIWITYIDTFYAMLDKKDDPKAGVRSSAIFFGDQARTILAILAMMFVCGLVGVGYLSQRGVTFYAFAVAGPALHSFWQLYVVDFDDADSCMMRFDSSIKSLGGLVFLGMLLG